METSDFYYDLPEELIAQTPLKERTDSRLMLLNKETGEVGHAHFRDLPGFLRAGDCLVLNDTKVLPARLIGVREDEPGTVRPKAEQAPSGAVELLLLRRLGAEELPEGYDPEDGVYWETLAGPGKRAKEGYRITFGNGELVATVIRVLPDGNRQVHFTFDGVFEEILDRLGQMPLPPYIHETLQDRDRYQTVYAREEGSAAAPTAGLHFTEALLDKLRAQGVKTVFVTLHVGLGTFRPVKEDNIEDHVMHKEWYTVTPEAAREINETKAAGGRIIAVGTTSCRTLESAATDDGIIVPGGRETGIFIFPGYKFKAIDALITNFHLPESTLIMLVSALAGREHVLAAYEEAVKERYRFFSFGDAMFIS